MRIKEAARRFDNTPCSDAYSGSLSFMGQLALYDDSKRDNEVGERRVISTSPDITLPLRRVVAAAGLKFIIGKGSPDTYKGEVIRMGYTAHEATHLARVQTLGQACRDEAGFTAWAATAWIKNASDGQNSSDLTPEVNLHFAQDEPVTQSMVITMGTARYLARLARVAPAGTLIVLADLMLEPSIDTASLTTGTWDPVTETMSGTSVSVRVLRARWQSLYEYRNSEAPKFGTSDLQVVVAKSLLTAQPGQKLTMSDGAWLVSAVADEGDVWICKATRHA
jgi:hypothetical protein